MRGVGRRLEVKDVHDGYARNFLIPKKLATPADHAALSAKAYAEEKEKHTLEEMNEHAKKLAEETFEFKVKAGPKGEVFGSVTADMIASELASKGFGSVQVTLQHALKQLGSHNIEIHLGKGIKTQTTILLRQL